MLLWMFLGGGVGIIPEQQLGGQLRILIDSVDGGHVGEGCWETWWLVGSV